MHTKTLKFATRPLDRERGLFPLPIIPVDYIGKFGGFASDDIEDVREYLLGIVVGGSCFGAGDSYCGAADCP